MFESFVVHVQLTSSQLESQFSTGEGIQDLFSTMDGGTRLPLPPGELGMLDESHKDTAVPGQRRIRLHQFQAGNPLFQQD